MNLLYFVYGLLIVTIFLMALSAVLIDPSRVEDKTRKSLGSIGVTVSVILCIFLILNILSAKRWNVPGFVILEC